MIPGMPALALTVVQIAKVICKTLILLWMLDSIVDKTVFLYRETLSYFYMLELLEYAKTPKDFQKPDLSDAERSLMAIITRGIMVIAVFLI